VNKLSFKNICFKVCECDVKKPHIYFYPDADELGGVFPTPFTSIEAVTVFLDGFTRLGYISKEKNEELLRFAKEANLEEKADETELGSIFPVVELINRIADRMKK